ncbi:MAG: 1,6-anhydro-N-acetylmuramyl-L-alanine amidase AmpD [Comamonadaceae bacterium]|nr:MAG: 1,6-anhydro-N-acetylmuramyl-L-alanine amidase AmpD [Comamonadaceae bacterium]
MTTSLDGPASPAPASAGAGAGEYAAWDEGWWRAARRLDSPNFGPRPAGVQIDLIVLHSISLPPGQYGGDEVQALFTNRLDWNAHPYFQQIRGLEVSAHFYVRRDGSVWQFVSCDARAWHAGASAWRGRSNCNDDSIGIELEGLEGERFDAPQYDALLRLMPALAQRYPIAHIAGHEHIAPGRKQDPGPGFDWWRLRRQLNWPADHFPTLAVPPR